MKGMPQENMADFDKGLLKERGPGTLDKEWERDVDVDREAWCDFASGCNSRDYRS